ncbi:MAG: 50S ribosomal protein L11 methyltransferase [Bacteroidota bacterium]
MDNLVYIGYTFKVSPLQPATEILIAELGYAGFESFVETQDGVTAYIQKSDWRQNILDDIQILKSDEFEILYSFEDIEQTNWNAEWEKNFQPIVVDNLCTVRAPFHKNPSTKYDIIIEPKMSFGTGHHETTYLMIQYLLTDSFQNKTVLDMGCGTGVLAILAEKLGANDIDAIDIDAWSYQNSIENVERNNCSKISVDQGDAELLRDRKYDVIIANINRNILINDMETYSKSLNSDGTLYLSGFYKSDIPLIKHTCQTYMLKLVETRQRGEWVALKFIN